MLAAPPSSTGPNAETRLGVYRAEDYGADHTRPDTSGGINLALLLAAAGGGGLVMLDSGVTYQVRRTVTLQPNTELVIPTGTALQAAAGLVGDVVAANAAAGVRISGGGTIDANRAVGTTGNGVTLTGCTEPQLEEISVVNAYQDGVSLVNCIRPVVDAFAGANGRHGVYHSGTTFGRGQITARDNGQRVAGSGLVFDAASTDNVYAPLVATDSRAGGAKTQQYGMLEVAASGCDRNVIAAASLAGNATGTLSLVGAASGYVAGAPTGAAGGQLGGNYPNPTVAGPVANAALAADVARANQLVNGGFEIWQRGNGPFTGPAWNADRWVQTAIGTDTLSVARNTANVDNGSTVCAACTFVLGTGAGATTINQQVLFADCTQLVGRTGSFSIRVRCATPNAVRAAFYNGAWNYSPFHSGSGLYETLTVPNIVMGGGQATCGVFFAASCTAYLDNAMLVVGSVPADYQPLPPADDLARCQRYYETLGMPGGNELVIGDGVAGGAGQVDRQTLSFKAQKAVTPTVTVVGAWALTNATGPTIFNYSTLAAMVYLTSVAAGQFRAINSVAGNTITAEANP